MMHGLASRLKRDTLIFLLSTTLGLTGCSFWPNTRHQDHRTVYYLQKEKTSVATHHHYKKTNHNAHKKSFWDSLTRDLTLLHYTKKPAVQSKVNHFLQRPRQLRSTIQRSAPYIHYIYEQTKKRHLPAELAFLPLIESTYNLSAINTASGSAGLWQLSFDTAERFGIRRDAIFDGRHDLDASTQVALDYLTYLNQLFCGNWLLTIAAYNTGEGNIKRAIRYNAIRNRSTSFWDLPIALETTFYVPKLLAISAIIKNPKKYGLELPPINKKAYLEQVDVMAGVSLVSAAVLANISIQELSRLNPGFKQVAFIPKEPYRLILPTTHLATFKRNIKQVSKDNLHLHLSYYQIKPGDTLNSIAKRHHVTVRQLCLWNGLKQKQTLPRNKILVMMKMPFRLIKTKNPYKVEIVSI